MEPSFSSKPPPPPPPPEDAIDPAVDAPTRALPLPPASTRRFHHYEVCLREDGTTLHELGRGAMGVSYKARDVNLDAAVALKVISASLPDHLHARERFRREARAAAQLRHPNVASVFHFGETPEGQCFYAMEFIEGETLSERVKREGPLPAGLVLEIALQVTAALIAADERGLVHRDLKPANLMLVATAQSRHPSALPRSGSTGSAPSSTRRVMVKVIDFGLAKAAVIAGAATHLDSPLTQEGGFLGTPAYASPEQAEGGEVDARSDIYSLGVTLWYLLCGSLPFTGRSFSEIYDRQVHRPLPVAHLTDARVPAPLAALLGSMLAADPAERPASPSALYEMIERCREEIGSPVAPPSRPLPEPGKVEALLPARRRRRGSRGAIVAAVVALALLAGAATFFLLRSPESSTPAQPAGTALDKSIAVLPLEDLSEDKANAFFADGIHDDLLSSLARIKELKVISRSSVLSYRDPARRNLREIGQQLGVTTVLEGSVRRAPDRVLVNVALIEISSGRQLWAERYDRTLTDALTLQGELATEIATALRATLSPAEKARVEARPTANADAYVLYLRARDYQTRPNTLLQDYQTAEHLYRQAIVLDPGFALAHARLSAVLAYAYENFGPTADVHDRARAEAEESLRLRPDLGEGHLARGLCLYWTEKDYAGALRELEVAAQLLPNNSEIDRYNGAIRRRQGHWSGAVESMTRALLRDPRSAQTARELMRTECLLRDWPAAARVGARAVAIAPDNLLLQFEKCSIDFWWHGDLRPVRSVLETVPAGVDPDGVLTLTRWEIAVVTRDFAAAEQAVEHSGLDTFVTQFGITMPKSYLLGCIALARGEPERAGPLLEEACAAVAAQAQKLPQDPFRQARLGVLHAYLGHKDEAIRHGLRAVEMLPEAKDTYLGPNLSAQLAVIYARTGETAAAVALLDRLLRTPGGLVPGSEGNVTQNDLRLRWQWDPLRGDPRFQKMLAGPEPKIIASRGATE